MFIAKASKGRFYNSATHPCFDKKGTDQGLSYTIVRIFISAYLMRLSPVSNDR